jgi:penicillin G amidase
VKRRNTAGGTTTWGQLQMVAFRHPLAISATASRRYNAGPFSVPGYQSTIFGTWRSTSDRSSGPAVQLILDAADWNRSRAIIAPGQSAAPDSPHFADLAPIWARGEDVPLPFSDQAVAAAAESTLVLEPR